jgi:LytS/YehU family sensor histidine kinase
VSLGHQFIDAIQARLLQTKATPAARHLALATLTMIVRHLGWQSYSCEKTAAELADLMAVKAPDMANTLALLEEVGAITRAKRGRTKIITINPEGAFRGDVNRHADAVDRYRAEVVSLRPEPAA